MNARTTQLLARISAMPHTHKCVTRFADGRTREFTTRSAASAEMHATLERRKIGRELINRDGGATVRVVAVTVERI